jgi:hypothetical protein
MACMHVLVDSYFAEDPSTWSWLTLSFHDRGVTKGKFRFESFVSGWSLALNEIFVSDHFILLPGSMRWARLISISSFFPWVFKAMDKLPPKMSLISSSCSSLLGSAGRWSPLYCSCAAGFSGIFLPSRKVLHSSRSYHIVWWISHHFLASVRW